MIPNGISPEVIQESLTNNGFGIFENISVRNIEGIWTIHVEYRYRRDAYMLTQNNTIIIEGRQIKFRINRMLIPAEIYEYWRCWE